MFCISDSIQIFVSAQVASLNNERLLVHRLAWPSVSKEALAVCIITSLDSITGSSEQAQDLDPNPGPATLVPGNRIIHVKDRKDGEIFSVRVHESATFRDLKIALVAAKPEMRVDGLNFRVDNVYHTDRCLIPSTFTSIWVFWSPNCCKNY